MPYCKQCGAKLPEDARFCPSCGTRVIIETKPVQTRRVLKVTGKPKVVITNTAPGSIEVKKGSKGEVTVDLDLRAPEDLDCNTSQEGNVVTVTCRMKAGLWKWTSYIFGAGPRANILVSVPAEADLDLENRAGRLKVAGVKGTLTAESSAGAVNMLDCEGTVEARTKAGSIDLENVSGTITARSSAGSIRFAGILSKSESGFKTSLGSIDLKLLSEPDLTVQASTNLGSIKCIPELTDAHYEGNRYVGRIGTGKGKLVAETSTGSITIRQ
ncbi:MAG: DUF4097 family beta strand repeat-containing protein [Candidatus Bathyarchaeota archaeon]|nr:DUF4097 family beta strand repeat-containing protein [Candidatus Bathyarchaeota archaeon]